MVLRSVWLRRGLILFSAAVVLRGVIEHRPHRLAAIMAIAGIFIAAIAIGWMFATRRER